jgi:hypothetical protein
LCSRGLDKEGFSLGKMSNIQEVFGDNWKVIAVLLPTTEGKGWVITFAKSFLTT